MQDAVYSTMIRSGKITFFVDVIQTKQGTKYIRITESRIGKDEKKIRATVAVPGESVQQFQQAISEATAVITG